METTACYSFHLSPSPTHYSKLPISIPNLSHKLNRNRKFQFSPISASLNSPKGFGPPPPKKIAKKPLTPKKLNNEEDEDNDYEEIEREAGVIPEVVTNRMLGRIGLSVGIPLFIGLLFFPFFYYLKVGLKIDIPNWVPFIVSFIFFGTALFGVSYGIVSTSWDPMREGSLLGWNEAQKNWPVFWQSIWGSNGSRNNEEITDGNAQDLNDLQRFEFHINKHLEKFKTLYDRIQLKTLRIQKPQNKYEKMLLKAEATNTI